jgi:hypothetical protein
MQDTVGIPFDPISISTACRAWAEGDEMSKGMPREWTKEEIRRLELLADGRVSADYIAKLLNRSITSVKSKAQWLNLSLIRRLKAKAPARPVSKPGRRLRAQELATKAIEKIIDPAAPPEERADRRRRLTKEPSEFREDRVDLPKANGK